MNAERNRTGKRTHGDRPIVVAGAAGQLGQTIAASFGAEWRTIGLTRRELDVTKAAEVRRAMSELRPWAIVNCVGYNHVDKAEEDATAALQSNALAVLVLARAAADVDATLVHYSSDFVFDGETDRPYREDDPAGPRSVYAASKLLGEWFAAEAPSHYVLRVESLFGGAGPHKSSLDRIIESIAAGMTTNVFVDRIVSPSYAWDVAVATASVLRVRPAPGLYHCVNSGRASWMEVATEVRRTLATDAPLVPVTLGDVKLAAERPRYCALSNEKLDAAGVSMPTWQDALERYLSAWRAGQAGPN